MFYCDLYPLPSILKHTKAFFFRKIYEHLHVMLLQATLGQGSSYVYWKGVNEIALTRVPWHRVTFCREGRPWCRERERESVVCVCVCARAWVRFYIHLFASTLHYYRVILHALLLMLHIIFYLFYIYIYILKPYLAICAPKTEMGSPCNENEEYKNYQKDNRMDAI